MLSPGFFPYEPLFPNCFLLPLAASFLRGPVSRALSGAAAVKKISQSVQTDRSA